MFTVFIRKMTIKDTFSLAFSTVKGNKLRSGITIAIIALGIMALIGIRTAIEAMNQSLKESFSSMGANAFNIRFKESNVNFGNNNNDASLEKRGQRQKKSTLNKPINKYQAEYFKENFKFNARTSIYIRGGRSLETSYGGKKTNPVSSVWGGDENYLEVTGYKLSLGRNLNSLDVQSGRNVCIVGSNVADKLFPGKPEQIVDAVIRVGAMPYRVVGLLKAKGSSMGRVDDIIVTSYNNARKYNGAGPSFFIGVIVNNVTDLDRATSEATAAFRGVRQLQPVDADNFVIEKSDKFAELFIGFLSGISALAIIIGFITLVGAAIGLMNIMLVAVNERTREVGLVKSIGGKSKDIRRQFLFESIIISLLGALFGIIAGILVGNLVAMALDTGFIVPWGWVVFGVAVCGLVGLIAGIYPAVKAGKLDPIVALRYE